MFLYSDRFVWIPFYLAVIYQIIKLAGKQSVWIIFSLILGIVFADQISSSLIKNLVERFRPSQDENLKNFVHIVNGYTGGKYGFVSSHSANMMSFALLSSLIFRNRLYTVFSVFWALLTGYSRIYLGVHYPGDVLGGFVVGILSGIVCYYLLKKLTKNDLHLQVSGINIPVYVLILNILGIALYSFF